VAAVFALWSTWLGVCPNPCQLLWFTKRSPVSDGSTGLVTLFLCHRLFVDIRGRPIGCNDMNDVLVSSSPSQSTKLPCYIGEESKVRNASCCHKELCFAKLSVGLLAFQRVYNAGLSSKDAQVAANASSGCRALKKLKFFPVFLFFFHFSMHIAHPCSYHIQFVIAPSVHKQ
jgi:hypothetical protein